MVQQVSQIIKKCGIRYRCHSYNIENMKHYLSERRFAMPLEAAVMPTVFKEKIRTKYACPL